MKRFGVCPQCNHTAPLMADTGLCYSCQIGRPRFYKKGICPVCNKKVSLRQIDGLIFKHGKCLGEKEEVRK